MFYKLNLKIEYPPPYECLVWDYKKADTNSMTRALKQVNSELSLQNKSFHEVYNRKVNNLRICLHIPPEHRQHGLP